MTAGRFTRAGARLLEILGAERCAIAGGMAVNAHGFVRSTRDVDLIVGMSLTEVRAKLREAGVDARLVRGDRLDGGFDCVKGVIGTGPGGKEGVPFDVLPALVPFEPAHAIDLVVRGKPLRVVDRDTLLRLKLKAGSIKDLYDIAILCNLHADWADRALALALERGADRARQVADLIRDPRVRGQARELERQSAALQAFARRQARSRRTKSPKRIR